MPTPTLVSLLIRGTHCSSCYVSVPSPTPTHFVTRHAVRRFGLNLCLRTDHCVSHSVVRHECVNQGRFSLTVTKAAEFVIPAAPGETHGHAIPWQRVVTFTAGAMALASIHRVAFSVLAVPFQAEFGLTMPQVGTLQSAVLLGYMLGQVPAGVIADKWGGVNVMVLGLIFWSLATGATPQVQALGVASVFPGLLAARAGLGLAQSCALPATSATAAQWVPEEHRSRSLTLIHAWYNFGTIAALCLTPLLTSNLGWPAALRIFAVAGLAWAGWAKLATTGDSVTDGPPQGQVSSCAGTGSSTIDQAGQGKGQQQGTTWRRLIFLCWTHVIISWGFFIFQAWIPTYLHHKGLTDLNVVGVLSALPWAAAASVGLLVGKLADWLRNKRQWGLVKVRFVMQEAASLGPALALAPLAFAQDSTNIPIAVVCLTAAVGLQGFCYAGFHSYVQDVAPDDAGKVLGLTNSCGTAIGVVANVAAGKLAAMKGGYGLLFGSMAALYLVSAVTWAMFAKGRDVRFSMGV